MTEKIIFWILALFRFECFEIGRRGLTRYLTRWTLLGKRFEGRHRLFLHCFHRGDAEDYPHDHPWPFWSLILWGGYFELTPSPDKYGPPGETVRKWYGPFRLLRRPAEWRHRVELPPGRKCWTLVWTGPKERSWGYICPARGWIPWREHQASQERGGTGCEG